MLATLLTLALSITPASAEELWPSVSTPVSSPSPTRSKDAALIVAIGDYDKVSDISGAAENGVDWYRYLTKSQRISPGRVRLLQNDQATREAIRKQAGEVSRLVKFENSRTPFSDDKIVKELSEKGIKIARRTVAKYRDEMGILPSHLRRSY